MSNQEPNTMTQAQALTNALWSAIHCPEAIAAKFTELAEDLARGMTPEQIELCKQVALKMESPE